ncbi:9497_t:CDS:2 [Paraglomus brasilianum]|uniref:9497_t:CDS:1 n=1 Tax=Paraglomus brasilianum TaxID=144538 RepID=A0A9N9G6A5_9GLOM|nr:9497_t:CDS:2 [Paraglomus brasilianum]
MAASINQKSTSGHSRTELFTTTDSNCTAMYFIDNLTPTEQELLRNPPYALSISFDNILNPIRKGCRNSSKKNIPPRPQNAWILFRRNFESRARSQRPGGMYTLKEISKTAGESWKAQPDKVKRYFNVLSKLALYRHKVMYPGYIYNSRKFKNGEKFIFKHMDKDEIAKSCNNKTNLSKKAKTSRMSDTGYISVGRNESYPENKYINEQPSTLPTPSLIVDISHNWSFSPSLPLHEVSDGFGVLDFPTQMPGLTYDILGCNKEENYLWRAIIKKEAIDPISPSI